MTVRGLWLFLAAPVGTGLFAAEPVHQVSLCRLRANPAAFHHKLVRVTAKVTHGFEAFHLTDPRCASPDVWIEYGGTAVAPMV